MNEFMTKYLGPLDKSSCIYFLFLTMIFFTMLIFAIIAEIIFAFKNFKNLNYKLVSTGIMLLFNLFIAYFVNRLLYTMCTKSLV
jgi:hypothetical protein